MPNKRSANVVVLALALTAWCSAMRTEAQPPPPGAAPIRLSAGALVPAERFDRALNAAAPASFQTGALHFIIQFPGRPTDRDRAALASLGVRLLDPVPVNAFFAVAVPPTAQLSLFEPGGPLDQPQYRAVVALPARYKISPMLQGALRGQPIPPHADRGNGNIAVTFRFHSDVPAQERFAVLRDLGVTVGAEPRPLQLGLEGEVAIANLLRVAEHDRIKSIDFIEREGQDDNDTVRGTAGADSDDVVTAYAVSGANVVIGQFEDGVPGSHKDLLSSVVVAEATPTVTTHATHVAGTMAGSGMLNSQWHGIAMGATIRAYDTSNRQSEYLDAIDNHGLIASNTSWDTSHCHQLPTSMECYDDHSQFYDQIISGRTEAGATTGLARRILYVGSAGNEGTAERYADTLIPNGQYDPGEPIYLDRNDNGLFDSTDLSKQIGTDPPEDTPLSNFALNERHDDLALFMGYGTGEYEMITLPLPDEVIYRDTDGSEDVSVGDVRLSGSAAGSHVMAGDSDVNIQPGDIRQVTGPGGAAGSTVAAGDPDVTIPERYLRQFRMWGNIRLQNSAKNTLTVGNYTVGLDTLAIDSSRGPTPDGRLKPDLVAPGSQSFGDRGVTSTIPVDDYAPFSGTSMAAPVVSAVAAMLIEWYRSACEDVDPKPSTLRAILLHSAVDMKHIPTYPGVFAGPDYAYGYGAVNAPNAMAVLTHHREGVATTADIGNPDAHTFAFTIGAVTDLKVTLAWDDPPWTAGTPRDPTTGLLQNDLDLELVSPSGKVYTPWRLDPSNPGQPAIPSPGYAAASVPDAARDHRNTVEQIVIVNAVAGTWTIRVLASNLNLPDQDFSLVGDFLEPEEGAPCNATPLTDVWVQDDPAEERVPSTAPWLSLDVWNDNGMEGPSGGRFNDDPVFDEVNDLYVRLRNRSNQIANGSSIDVWAAPASIAPSWPNDFAYVGRLPAPGVGARQSRVFGPLPWVPTRRSPSEQLSYYVRVTNPRDPIPPGARGAAQSNNIALRNVHELDIREGTHFISFGLSGLTSEFIDQPQNVDLVISVTPPSRTLPISARLLLDPDVERRWLGAGGGGSGFTVTPGSSQDIALSSSVARLRLSVDPRDPDERLFRAAVSAVAVARDPIQLDVVQCSGDRVVGGIRYVLHTGSPRPAQPLGAPAWFNGHDCSIRGSPR
jgi:subtilase family protein